MRRYELAGRRKLRWTDQAPVPVPGPGEVLVRVGAGTVCNRSDLVYFHYLGEREHCGQGVFGHEIAGTVESAGIGVNAVAPGDRVFVRTPLTSGFAEFALAREVAIGKLPEQVPFAAGAILQLLPLAVHATRGVRLGDRVAILGQGPVGLMALQVALRRGAVDVVVADLDPWRLERAACLGAHRTVTLPGGNPVKRPKARGVRGVGPPQASVEMELIGAEFDVAIDAVGTPHTVNACVELVRRNGLVVLLGTHHVDTHVAVDLIAWEKKGLRVHTAAESTDTDRAAAMAVAERLAPAITLTPLLTETYPLERLPEAIERLSASSLLYPASEPSPYRGPPPRTLKLAIVP